MSRSANASTPLATSERRLSNQRSLPWLIERGTSGLEGIRLSTWISSSLSMSWIVRSTLLSALFTTK